MMVFYSPIMQVCHITERRLWAAGKFFFPGVSVRRQVPQKAESSLSLLAHFLLPGKTFKSSKNSEVVGSWHSKSSIFKESGKGLPKATTLEYL